MSDVSKSTTRRQVLKVATGTFLYLGGSTRAAEREVGIVAEIVGRCFAKANRLRILAKAASVVVGEAVWTEASSKASIDLNLGGRLHLGPECHIVIDHFISNVSGELVLEKGALIFDRAEKLPKTNLLLRTQFGQLAVRGTKFFAGPSQGRFSVFVEHGTVDVSNNKGSVTLTAGEGTDFSSPGAPPSPKKRWGAKRAAAALASVME